jgi:FKBP12-rapamycin complex-associated protein
MIRRTVLTSLSTQFDHHLSQASNLASLFITLNDEVFDIREISLAIICRLALCNPAYVLPALRTTLIHLITQVELSGDNNTKEESSKLLANLIRDCPTLVKPYSSRIMKALLPKLRDVDPLVSSSVLATVGELAVVNGAEVMAHVSDLMPLIIDTLQDLSSSSKREVALRTLGQLAESAGYVIDPYLKYPKLLDAIVSQIQSERTPGIRKEVITVLGILGALDPYRHKMNQLILEGRAEDEEGTGRTQKTADSKDSESIANLSPSSEDYYPTITIAALMRILKDPSLSIHHTTVIHVLMSIVKSLGMKSIQFLPQIMPPFLQVMKSCEPELRTIMFQQLGLLVVRVKQHIRDYLAGTSL